MCLIEVKFGAEVFREDLALKEGEKWTGKTSSRKENQMTRQQSLGLKCRER